MNERRRLVFAWNYLSWGGAQVYFLATMKLAREKWDTVVRLPRASSPEIVRYISQLGIEYKLVDDHLDLEPADGITRKLERRWTRLKVEYQTFRDLLKYDVRRTVFHIEVAPWQSLAFLTAMSLRGAKLFLTLHNSLPADAPANQKLIWKARLRYVSYLPGINFFTSNVDTKNRLRGLVTDKFWDRIRVTFTAVNPPQIDEALTIPFDRPQARQRHGIAVQDFVVLCVGQFIDRKGRWVFLDAARRILDLGITDVSFVWVTPEMPSDEDQTRIGEYSLRDKLRIVHSQSLGTERLDVLSFFRVADAFALPSYVEGLPIALLEAMALELPSISTNVYAIPEAVKHLETGILIEAGDSAALADAIMKLKNNAELRQRLAESGRQFVLENFDERDAARAAIAAYEEALGQTS